MVSSKNSPLSNRTSLLTNLLHAVTGIFIGTHEENASPQVMLRTGYSLPRFSLTTPSGPTFMALKHTMQARFSVCTRTHSSNSSGTGASSTS